MSQIMKVILFVFIFFCFNRVGDATQFLKDDMYFMQCRSTKPIKYCWFLAPNGTYYSLSQNTTNSFYEYKGSGFDTGECGIKINKATLSDNGIWKCNLGINKERDLRISLGIQVYETPLVAKEKKLFLTKSANIQCETFDKSPLDYCRFIRPDGYGVNPFLGNKYYSSRGMDLENGRCSLIFNQPAVYDIGNWSCIAKPTSGNREYVDNIFVYRREYQEDTSVLNIFIWILWIGLIAAIIIISSVILFKLRIDAKTNREARLVIGGSSSA